jgi:hypothetical protein
MKPGTNLFLATSQLSNEPSTRFLIITLSYTCFRSAVRFTINKLQTTGLSEPGKCKRFCIRGAEPSRPATKRQDSNKTAVYHVPRQVTEALRKINMASDTSINAQEHTREAHQTRVEHVNNKRAASYQCDEFIVISEIQTPLDLRARHGKILRSRSLRQCSKGADQAGDQIKKNSSNSTKLFNISLERSANQRLQLDTFPYCGFGSWDDPTLSGGEDRNLFQRGIHNISR